MENVLNLFLLSKENHRLMGFSSSNIDLHVPPLNFSNFLKLLFAMKNSNASTFTTVVQWSLLFRYERHDVKLTLLLLDMMMGRWCNLICLLANPSFKGSSTHWCVWASKRKHFHFRLGCKCLKALSSSDALYLEGREENFSSITIIKLFFCSPNANTRTQHDDEIL